MQSSVSPGIWLGMLIGVAAFLRIVTLGRPSFWLDEAASSMLARTDWHTFFAALMHRQVNMALYYVLLRGWIHLGHSEALMRTLSVLFGVAAVPVMYQLASNIFGRKTARISALLLSVHQFHVQYSQEARGYSLLVFLGLLSSHFFVRLWSRPVRTTWLAYTVTSVLLIYAHVFGAWILIAQWLCAAISRSNPSVKKEVAKAACTIAVLASPLVGTLLFVSSRSQLSWMNQHSAASFYRVLLDFSGNPATALFILEVSLVLVSIMFRVRRPGSADARVCYNFISIWLLLPTVIMGLLSLQWPILQSRYLIVSLPPFLLLISDGLARLRSRALFVAATMAVAAFSLLGVASYLRGRADVSHSDNWRDATRYILSEARSGDAVLFPYSAEEIPFREYQDRFADGKQEIPVVPSKTDLELLSVAGIWTAPEVALAAARPYSRIWLSTALEPNERSRQLQEELSRNFRIVSRRTFGYVTIQMLARPEGQHSDGSAD
jgi:mannosyltransferase